MGARELRVEAGRPLGAGELRVEAGLGPEGVGFGEVGRQWRSRIGRRGVGAGDDGQEGGRWSLYWGG